MAWFRKLPIDVEAVKLPALGAEYRMEENFILSEFVREHPLAFRGFSSGYSGWSIVTVDDNRVTVPWGAYCVIDSKGFAYPCDAEIFEANHESLDPVKAPREEGVND